MTSIIIISCLEILFLVIAFFTGYYFGERNKSPRFDADRKCDKCGRYMVSIAGPFNPNISTGHVCNNKDCESYGK